MYNLWNYRNWFRFTLSIEKVQEDELTASHSEQAKLQGGAFERRGLSRYRQTRKMSRGASLHRSRLHEDIPLTTVTVST